MSVKRHEQKAPYAQYRGLKLTAALLRSSFRKTEAPDGEFDTAIGKLPPVFDNRDNPGT